ncbi:SDR family oxidoreductase [Sphingomonas sp. CGMCC 1.13654]|uniref:SDR family oxidoreductase n=1 Tax=Sphingomonas chungangi TaxID=2683589 RepID=A0A838LCH4_9SPHN|nr:SDR family oxidoreductase [Sphingomonas chungangi]MBA2936572.1 SDR family oxidoreductase [Sphingomonas chungangi]MVW55957.1 SDR family NAD(P)-dependent oxidoreductase [Sphingomonas chungangi]
MSINKDTVLITGASTGIGAVYADRFAKRGHDLVLVARDMGRMEALAERLRGQTGVAIEIIGADLTLDTDLAKIEVRLAKGDIGILINNAGMSLNGSILENGPTELSRIIALNITAPTRLAAAAAKVFAAKGEGAVINIASVLALAPEMFDGVYSGTKAHLLNLSQAMAAQLSEKGVYTQAVLPGATRTEIWERSGKDVDAFPEGFVMAADDLVDAALVGFDRREPVTIPPLPDMGQFDAMQQARAAMGPNLSKSAVAERYREAVAA